MNRKRRKYDKEFKKEAVRLVHERNGKVTEVAEGLGISPANLQRWKKELSENPDHAFPGLGKLKSPDDEIRRLQKETRDLKEERDILKKALAIFSKRPE